jgi:hypothetical protein
VWPNWKSGKTDKKEALRVWVELGKQEGKAFRVGEFATFT